MRRIILIGAAIGLLIPALFTLFPALGDINGHLVFMMWPSVILAIGLDHPLDQPPPEILKVVIISLMIGINVILYSFLAFLITSVWRHSTSGHILRSIIFSSVGVALVVAWIKVGLIF